MATGMTRSLLVLFALVVSACIPALVNHPVQFASPMAGDGAVDAIARSLAVGGQTVAMADRQVGIVQTRWENTGFGYGFVGGANLPAVIWRRYTIVIGPASSGVTLTVRADTQRCVQGRTTTTDGVNLNGECTTLYADGLVPEHQAALESLGAQLKQALGGT
jgi:hypothetical protein